MFCINTKTPFVFIHIPKTAGGSFKLLLCEEYGDEINKIKTNQIKFSFTKNYLGNIFKRRISYHTSYDVYKNMINNKIFDKFLTFTVIRNPYDRFFSLFKWKSNLFKAIEDPTLSNFNKSSIEFSMANLKKCEHLSSSITFKDFVKNYKTYLNENELKSQFDYGAINCKRILKYEKIELESVFLLNELNIKKNLPYVHVTEKKNFEEYYDEESRSIVYYLYKKDFDTFGYKP